VTDAVIIGVTAVILSVAYTVAVTVLVSRALYRTLSTLDRIHARQARQLETALNRLMTIKWENFAMVQATEDADEEGGFYRPDEDDEDDTMVMKPNFDRVPSLEQEFLEEDFDEAGVPRRSAS
jgi:hypothetical protein